jgi:fatty acid elongase 3
MQIGQFIIDLVIVYFGSAYFNLPCITAKIDHHLAYERMAFKYFPGLPHISNCAGSERAAIFGCALLTSYLFLFINFYFQTYKKPANKKPTSNGIANGHANGKANGTANGASSVFLFLLCS